MTVRSQTRCATPGSDLVCYFEDLSDVTPESASVCCTPVSDSVLAPDSRADPMTLQDVRVGPRTL